MIRRVALCNRLSGERGAGGSGLVAGPGGIAEDGLCKKKKKIYTQLLLIATCAI